MRWLLLLFILSSLLLAVLIFLLLVIVVVVVALIVTIADLFAIVTSGVDIGVACYCWYSRDCSCVRYC